MPRPDIPADGATLGPEGLPLPERKLEGWKEISNYLGRDKRTVQRWEKTESLPIRRHEHEKKSTVYAYPGELDEWRKNRQPKDDPEADRAFQPDPDTEEDDDFAPNGIPPAHTAPIPDAIQTPAPPAADEPESPAPPPKRLFAFAAVAILIVGFAAYTTYRLLTPSAGAIGKVRLVVLPLTNLSGDATKDFLSRGMTDVITTQLGQLDPEHLGIIAPSSAAAMAGHPIREIRQKLNVQYIVEGSVQPIGDRVQVDIRLVQAGDETQAGSKTFTRPFANVLELESEVAETVAHMIIANLPVAIPAGAPPGVVSADAARRSNEAFLKAETLWTARSNLKGSIELFEQATLDNPYNAQAFAGLAGATALYGQVPNDGISPAEALSKARAAAQRALQLDPKLAEPHAVLGNVAMSYEWDFRNAENEFKAAIQLNPNSPAAHEWYAHLLMVQGRFDEALAQSQQVLDIEPATPLFHSVRAEILYYSRKYDEAIQESEGVINSHPDFVLAYYWKGCAYREKKMYPEAISTFARARALVGDLPFMVMAYGHAQAVAGNTAEARSALNTLLQMQHSRIVPDIYLAAIEVGLGDKDKAFAYLDKAYQDRRDRLVYLKVEPMADPLRSDPRFAPLLAKIGIP